MFEGASDRMGSRSSENFQRARVRCKDVLEGSKRGLNKKQEVLNNHRCTL